VESETAGRAVLGWAIFPSRRDRNQEEAIVGMPDERWGEAPHAFVVLKAGATATETELRNYARDHLAHFKCPQKIHFVPELPKTATGKVQKYVLRGKQPAISKQ